MNDRTKKILIWGSVITLVGVSGYLGYRLYSKRKKAKAEAEEKKLADMQALISQQNQNSGSTNESGNGSGSTSDCPPELNTPDKIKAFQDYMDLIGVWVKGDDGKYKKLLKGKGYGVCGKNTILAWKTYGTPFQQTQAPSDEANSKPTISENLRKDIDTIVAMGSGDKSRRSYLESGIGEQSKKDWVMGWANALRANKSNSNEGTVFTWRTGGKDYGLYEAYSGQKVLNFNPAGRKPKPISGAYFYKNPTADSSAMGQAVGSTVGTVTGYKWNNSMKKLWLYVPLPLDSYVSDAYLLGAKWIPANDVKF